MHYYKRITILVLAMNFAMTLFAQQALKENILPAYTPSRSEMLDRYRAVAKLDSAVKNTTFKTSVQANWQEGGNALWYRNVLKDSVAEYIYVDVLKGIKQKAFDQEKMAAVLSQATGKTLDGQRLFISKMEFAKNAANVSLELDKKSWEVDLSTYT